MEYHDIFIVASKENMLEATIKFIDGRSLIVKDDLDCSTLNRKEAYLIAKALSIFEPNSNVVVHCYSNYVPNSLQPQWIKRWQSNGWRTQNNELVKNQDLLKILVFLGKKLNLILLEPFNHFRSVDLFDNLDRFMKKEEMKNVQ